MPVIGNIDHWYELIVWLVLIVIGPGGGAALANVAASRRRRREREAELEQSVDLHASVFNAAVDKAVADLNRSLQRQIAETVGPILDRQAEVSATQDEIARDLRRIDLKLDTYRTAHDVLEKDTYRAIAKAERVIAKHHPEDDH